MKREGRQHGFVQTYPIISSPWNPRSGDSRCINKLNAPPTAGLFTKVSQKPNNHSKFSGKCGRSRCVSCHILPAGKAREKTKGTQKLGAGDVVTNYRMANWRATDARSGLKFTGFSATRILDYLASDSFAYEDEIEDDDDDAYEEYNYGLADFDWMADSGSAIASRIIEIEEASGSGGDYKAENDDDDDDKISFSDAGTGWKHVQEEDEGWLLVEDLQNCT